MTKYIKSFITGLSILIGVLIVNNASAITPLSALTVNPSGNVINTNTSINFTSTVSALGFIGNLAGSTNSNDLFLTSTTNIFGGTNNADYYITNSALSFTVTGTAATPSTYELRGYIECTSYSNNANLLGNNNAAGGVWRYNTQGTDKVSGMNLIPGGFGGGTSTFTPNFASSQQMGANRLFQQILNTGQSAFSSCYIDMIITTKQTNTYNPDCYNNSANTLITPCFTTNTFLEIRKVSPTF